MLITAFSLFKDEPEGIKQTEGGPGADILLIPVECLQAWKVLSKVMTRAPRQITGCLADINTDEVTRLDRKSAIYWQLDAISY